ncbi:sulfurtransferase TusA family protein [Candidatus Obscuribacterales bacterium]|nr:sulfurtransferase TusA family protein [Candidatus Obscuribacterales bacterium]MBX3135948.1 sulfurtransferase TusA family protein [Candidatus Obscuribacterales bacterium]MBX3152615.1 sulfurtransferase TusA family protein [Candidatus Obscuribacterales bacterium]
MADYELDLRGVACPMNFVKTRLFLDKIASGDVVKVLLDAGEPVESVSSSIESEGHKLEETVKLSDEHFSLLIRKA